MAVLLFVLAMITWAIAIIYQIRDESALSAQMYGQTAVLMISYYGTRILDKIGTLGN